MVAKEVERAINYNKPIIPIMLEKVTLTEEFELYISTDQIVSISDFTKDNDNLTRLIHAITSHTSASNYSKQQLIVELGGTAENGSKKGLVLSYKPITILVAVVLVLVIAIVSIVSALGKKPTEDNSGSTQGSSQNDTSGNNSSNNPIDYLPQNVNVNDNVNNGSGSDTKTPTTPNQIPTRYEQDIQALQNADALSLSNKTVYVKVGELATPGASIAWTNVTVYSQNTNIAIGEGKMVKGVAPGETYVIVDTNGMMGSAYRVIVEE